MKKLISVVSPCYNEQDNLMECHEQVKRIFSKPEILDRYNYEHIFIDNSSTDKSEKILREISAEDENVKVIFNSRNFGHIRSPYHGLLQAKGDAVIQLVSDLQDPPELIPDFLRNWEEGFEIVIGEKTESHESSLMFFIRKMYYNLINKLSDIQLQKNFTGFGLYDKKIIDILKKIDDPYPYFRGLIFEIGFKKKSLAYTQPARVRGITKNNFFTLYDIAMLGITTHSKIPLRIATIGGFLTGTLSFLAALIYFVYKLLFWNSFSVGIAPLVIGVFFFASIILFFIGIIGEYIGFIYTKVQNRPLVIEKERLNFSN